MKLAFIKTVGMSSGGGERYLQTMAIILAKAGHSVDYFYTNNAPCAGTSWMHPDNDDNRINYVKSFGINVIPVHVDLISQDQWYGTDFFSKFKESDYDFIHSCIGGGLEFPFNKIDTTKIIDTVHGTKVYHKENTYKSVLLCNWQANLWAKNGGDLSKAVIIPSIVYVPPKTLDNYRKELNIPENAFVYGYHQRHNEDGLFSPMPLDAFKYMQDSHFIIMGGASAHRNYAKNNDIKNVHFIDHSSKTEDIHKFLQTLNCYAHSKSSGEVCSACIIEAMYHGLPVISHPGNDMGHLEMIDGCGKMASSINEYATEMKLLKANSQYWKYKHEATLDKYLKQYSFQKIEQLILDLYKGF